MARLKDVAHHATIRLPAVLTRQEVKTLLELLHGTTWLIASLLFRTGMHVFEGLLLPVKDIDLEGREIAVREGGDGEGRVPMVPEELVSPQRVQLLRGETPPRTRSRRGRSGSSVSRRRWLRSTPPCRRTGVGSMCSRPPRAAPIRATARSSSITSIPAACSGRCAKRHARRSPFIRMCFAIPSPRTCCRTATTFEPCTSCSATRTSARLMVYAHLLNKDGRAVRSPLDGIWAIPRPAAVATDPLTRFSRNPASASRETR